MLSQAKRWCYICMNTIYLVRHGENISNLTREFSCKHVDHPLTPRGVLQAEQTAEFFKDRGIDEVYASPMKRTRETAGIIAQASGLTVNLTEHFREVNVGTLEFQPPTDENWDIHRRVVAEWYAGRHEVLFPEGENYLSLLHRMQEGLLQATRGKHGKNILIVGHAGIFSFTIKDICMNIDPMELKNQGMRNCSITTIELEVIKQKPTGRLKDWAVHSHLSGEATPAAWNKPPEIERK